VVRQLVAAGLLEVDIEGHGALRLTSASSDILKGRRTLSLRSDPPARARRRERGTRDSIETTLAPAAASRFECLRQWRGDTARAQGVPAYVIFHDSTLREIALQQPADLDALAAISGVGAGKLERYGRAVLDAVAADAC
jgi:ATP-dependent DNA helicase RecQ